MTIDKAIENLEEEAKFEQEEQNHDMVASIQLGIEALKWIEFHRRISPERICHKLPGETEE